MTTHGPHDDIYTHGLADGCPRCAEQAARPVENLDGPILRELVRRVHENDDARSENEAVAMARIKDVLAQTRRLATAAPALVSAHLRDHW